jgi:alpha/beta superfamily hydrolase
VFLAGEEPVSLRTEDGLTLRALGCFPAEARRAVILCHPHPLYGGTMHNAVVLVVNKYLRETGGDKVATLRFNYRGVDGSEGAYDHAKREALDVRAALFEAARRAPGARLSVMAYSFGTRVALRALAEPIGDLTGPDAAPVPEVERLALVAPAVRIFHFPEDRGRFAGAIEIFTGDADQFSDVVDVRTLSDRFGAPLHVLSGSDHYFIRFRRKLAELVAPFVAPEIQASPNV